MAKAQFHRNQKVWVETVGTWAVIEKIVPVWAKGFDEPVRITYDVGLGPRLPRPRTEGRGAGRRGGRRRRRRRLAAAARPQQVAGARGLQPPPLPRHLPGGGHRRRRLGRLARAGRGIRPRPAQDRVPGPADRHRAQAAGLARELDGAGRPTTPTTRPPAMRRPGRAGRGRCERYPRRCAGPRRGPAPRPRTPGRGVAADLAPARPAPLNARACAQTRPSRSASPTTGRPPS